MDITFGDIVQAAQKLTSPEKVALIKMLQPDVQSIPVTREHLIAELEALRIAGAFDKEQSLYAKYARPGFDGPSEEELHAYLHEVGTEWEKELDDLIAPD